MGPLPQTLSGLRRLAAAGFLATAAAASPYPKPAPAAQFPEFKLPDRQGNAWRAAREDWEGARQRVREDPDWAEWVRRERAEVERWRARHHDRVEWLPGWSHAGVSPKDGSRLVWNDRIPHEEVQFFSSPSDPEVEITPKLHAWWVVTFRGQHVEMLVRAARLHRLTGDTALADWVRGQLDFYADNFLRWEPQRPGHPARLFWQTLTEASNLVKFTEAVRLLGPAAPPEQRAGWLRQFFLPEVRALNSTQQAIHNIAVWQRCAVAQVALLFGDNDLWREALDGRFGLRAQLAEGVTGDYLWQEQSLGYNSLVLRAVYSLALAAGLAGRAGELGPELALAHNLLLAPLVLRFPNGELPNPADSGRIGRAPAPDLFAEVYRVFPTPLGLEEAGRVRDWNTLLDPPARPPAAVPLPEVTSRNLESSRMAVLRGGGWQVFFHYGQLTRTHSQAEALNYSVYWGERPLSRDPGTVGYGSPLHRGYYARALNHNVPLVDGEGQQGHAPGELTSFAPDAVVAAQPVYRPGVRAARALALRDGALVDTADVTSTTGPRRLGLALHFQGRVRLPGSFRAAADWAVGRPEEFGYWTEVTVREFRGEVRFEVDLGGGTRVPVVIAVPGSFRVWQGSSPDVPPRRRESLYLELTEPAASATFVTTFRPPAGAAR